MNEKPKNKGGRPRNKVRQRAEKALGVSSRHVRRIMHDIGVDQILDLGELKIRKEQILITLRHIQAEQAQEELDTARRLRQGELIRVEDAIATYAGSLAEIRAQLANVPDRLCAQLNPDNPDIARKILWSELERIGAAVAEKIRSL